ncbi:MAG TPA: hypothetical protein DIS76_07445 [Rhodospirillaceae bacterium]|nr:hypothetical protein [Rhodospirillaceae bacterium]
MTEMQTPFLSAPAPLPVRKTLHAALRILRDEWKNIFILVALPSLALALLALIFKMEIPGTEGHSVNVVHGIVSIFALPWLAVSLLRFLVLGENKMNWIPPYQPRMWSYMWRQFLVGLAAYGPAVLLAVALFGLLPKLVASIAALLFICAATLVTARLSLVVPASALGTDNRLVHSWELTRGQIFRITLVKFLLAVMTLAPILMVVIISAALDKIAPAVAMLVSIWLVTMLQIILLQIMDALIYAHFMQTEGAINVA